jgi:hypothetical protein
MQPVYRNRTRRYRYCHTYNTCTRKTRMSFYIYPYHSIFNSNTHELGNCSSLVLLSLAANQLQGTIPDAPGSAANQLRYLYLTLNSLVGVVPPSTGNLSSLVLLPFLPKQSGGDLCPISVDELGGNRLQADDDQGWEFLRSLTNCTRKCCCWAAQG